MRLKFPAGIEAILQAYPHTADAEALRSAKDTYREASFAWSTWNWACLHAKNGKNKVFVYYFDRRTPTSPNGSSHAEEISFVFDYVGDSSRPDGRITVIQVTHRL